MTILSITLVNRKLSENRTTNIMPLKEVSFMHQEQLTKAREL